MTDASTITIDALESDPFPIYVRLRRDEPLISVPAANCWFATRWKDIEAMLAGVQGGNRSGQKPGPGDCQGERPRRRRHDPGLDLQVLFVRNVRQGCRSRCSDFWRSRLLRGYW